MEGAALSDQGRERACNEDRAEFHEDLGLAVLVDGMGGAGVGDRIAEQAMMTIVSSLERWPEPPREPHQDEHPLVLALNLANLQILELTSHQRSLRGGGAAVISAQATRKGFLLAWVGEVRGYLWRHQQLRQLTPDAWTQQDFLLKELDAEEIFHRQHQRALGLFPQLHAQTHLEAALPGDLLLLCSDGLYWTVSDREIAACLTAAASLPEACARLVQEANESGGHDNISVVLLRWPPR